jgi:Domain of unknown function (DUF4333)
MKTLSAVFALVACCCLLAACGSSGTSKISKDDLSKEAQSKFDAIAKSRGAKFPPIKCPKDLDNKKGAKTRCTAKGTDGTLGITATVVHVDGDKAQLSFKADSALTK